MSPRGNVGPYRATNHFLEIDGENKTIAEWSKEYGTSEELIHSRLKSGWDPELAVTTPPRKYKRKESNAD